MEIGRLSLYPADEKSSARDPGITEVTPRPRLRFTSYAFGADYGNDCDSLPAESFKN